MGVCFFGDPVGNRTRVTAVKGRCLDRLTTGPYENAPCKELYGAFCLTGKDLFSRAVAHRVSSALRSLTTVFEMGTGVTSPLYSPDPEGVPSKPNNVHPPPNHWSSARPISIGQLHALPHFHLRPINVVVSHGSYPIKEGNLVLWGASHLDAFSAYPVQT